MYEVQIGNALINDETDTKGMFDYFASHALISDQTSYKIRKFCNFSPNATTQSNECYTAAAEVGNEIGNIDIYNIYAPLCTSFNITPYPKKATVIFFPTNLRGGQSGHFFRLCQKPALSGNGFRAVVMAAAVTVITNIELHKRLLMFNNSYDTTLDFREGGARAKISFISTSSNGLDSTVSIPILSYPLSIFPRPLRVLNFDPCSDDYVYAYLNRADVQEALHANVTKLSYDWEPCSQVIRRWEDSPSTIIPLLQELMANGLRVWLFSGDIDGRIPVTSTKYSINKMKLHLKTPWHPWYLNGEVGGYTEVYKGDLTFATVRGAGHRVPSYQPARALSLVMHFLAGTPLPNSTTLLQ
ncbi:hypothetical protein HYC85_010481 [Camellia sinensis]|uniref:Uncharacterized protein n=1 Tax=Camellia sinensis TaxID=4442 RepID=A0A7J7HJE0_CAMSI|nr:hypothetical protein HYC85_010481 [Camellia sinensis]